MTLSLAGRGMKPRELLAATVQPAAVCGLGAGFVFAFTTVFIKLGNQSLTGPSLVVRALFTLVVTNVLQILMQGSWLYWRERGELKKAFTSWRSSMWVGTLSGCGSACWFTGFAIAEVALVRAVGQIEIVFTLLFSRFYLKEILRSADVAGLSLVVLGRAAGHFGATDPMPCHGAPARQPIATRRGGNGLAHRRRGVRADPTPIDGRAEISPGHAGTTGSDMDLTGASAAKGKRSLLLPTLISLGGIPGRNGRAEGKNFVSGCKNDRVFYCMSRCPGRKRQLP